MYAIVVYDVEAKRTTKFHKYLKKRLKWIQNSIFEGEISDSEFYKLNNTLKKMCKKDESVVIYTFFSSKYVNRYVLGNKEGKDPKENLI